MRLAIACALALTGCLLKPDKIELAADAHTVDTHTVDARVALQPRLISNSYWSVSSGGSPIGMSGTRYSVLTDGVLDGDLLLFIANEDNGCATLFVPPPGFTTIVQHEFGGDTQTYAAFWKIAGSEPAEYTEAYNCVGSGAATITLMAISGVNVAAPINKSKFADGGMNETLMGIPFLAPVGSVTTDADGCLLVYAAGADWTPNDQTNTFTTPQDFTQLTAFGDHGVHTQQIDWDWTSQMVAYKYQSQAGATGVVQATIESDGAKGIPWAVLIAVAPAP